MSQEVVFLTMQELVIKLRISQSKARQLLKAGFLVGLKIPGAGGKHGEWRIVDPGPRFAEYLRSLDERLVYLPLLSIRDVAEIVGYTFHGVYSLVRRGKLKPEAREGKRRIIMFSISEVRRYLWSKERLARPATKEVKLETLIRWSKGLLDRQNGNNTEATREPAVLGEIEAALDDIEKLPNPQRIQSLLRLYEKLDQVQLLNAARKADYQKLQELSRDLSQQEAAPVIH